MEEKITDTMTSLPYMQGHVTLLDIFNIHVDIYNLSRRIMLVTKQHRQDSTLDVSIIHNVFFA